VTLYLGVDVGSTRTKLVVWDAEADVLVSGASVRTPVVPGPVERRDHAAVWDALGAMARTLPDELRRGIRAVSVASIGEEIALLGDDGRSVGPTPCWYALDRADDARSGEQLSREHLAFLRRNDPGLVARAVGFTDVGSHIAMRLAGLAAELSVMDRSHASRTGFIAPTGEWDAAAVAENRVEEVGRLPRLVESGEPLGPISPAAAASWGLPHDIVVHAGGHDHFCGALAAGAAEPGDVFVSVGTSESVLQLVDREAVAAWPADGLERGFFVTPGLGYLHGSRRSGRRIAGLLTRHGLASLDPLYLELDGGLPATQPAWRRIRREALSVPVSFASETELSGKGAAMLAAPERSRR
jgi:sugar (pentulose or hexulose) kinase